MAIISQYRQCWLKYHIFFVMPNVPIWQYFTKFAISQIFHSCQRAIWETYRKTGAACWHISHSRRNTKSRRYLKKRRELVAFDERVAVGKCQAVRYSLQSYRVGLISLDDSLWSNASQILAIFHKENMAKSAKLGRREWVLRA